jgi:hypothetical protein
VKITSPDSIGREGKKWERFEVLHHKNRGDLPPLLAASGGESWGEGSVYREARLQSLGLIEGETFFHK